MIRVRYRGSNELSPGLHATAERDGRRTTVYLLDGMTAVQRRSALRRLRLTARMGHCPRLPAAQLAFALFTDRIRTGIGRAGRVLRLHPAGSTVPIIVRPAGRSRSCSSPPSRSTSYARAPRASRARAPRRWPRPAPSRPARGRRARRPARAVLAPRETWGIPAAAGRWPIRAAWRRIRPQAADPAGPRLIRPHAGPGRGRRRRGNRHRLRERRQQRHQPQEQRRRDHPQRGRGPQTGGAQAEHARGLGPGIRPRQHPLGDGPGPVGFGLVLGVGLARRRRLRERGPARGLPEHLVPNDRGYPGSGGKPDLGRQG
jgi:hypothetical protein